VRGQTQGLGIAALFGLAQQAQALLGIDNEGIEQQRILVFHDILQGSQHGIVEMDIGHLITP
jgi:hypothetical protein